MANQDPRSKQPQPDFPRQEQSHPGREAELRPAADHGEGSYRGHGRGIRVNAVAPGPVWTPLVAKSFEAEKNAQFGKQTPLGRPGQPAELAPAFVFLACEESSFVTGEVLGVTGGQVLP